MGRTVAVLVLVCVLGGGGQALAASKPDLKVTKVSGAPASGAAGSSFKLSVTVKNAGGRKAKASRLAAFLSTDARRSTHDVRLTGAPKVKALARGKAAKGGRRFTIPAAAKAGIYRVLVCADAKGAVKERSEKNNCRAAKGSLRIPAIETPGPGPQIPPPPQPPTQPSATPAPTGGSFLRTPDPIDVGGETLDTAHAVTHSSTFPLTTTAADGTKYTLTIPSGALLSPTDITMTPVTAIQGMPLGQLIGAVHLEPYGLQLVKAATLTIEPPTEAPIADQTGFLFHQGGDDFHLAPLQDTRTLTLALTHFSTPGVAAATDGQRQNVASHAPIRNLAQFEQALADYARSMRARDLGQPVGDVPDAATIRSEYFEQVVMPELKGAENEDAKAEAAIADALGWARELEVLGAGDSGLEAQMWQEIQVVLRNAVDRASILCQQQHDLHQIIRLMAFEREAQVLGLDLGDASGKALACGHFEVNFDATFTTDQAWTSTGGDRTFQENGTWEMAAERVPIDISGGATSPLRWKQFDFHSVDTLTGSSCTLTTIVDGVSRTDGNVRILLDLDLNAREVPPTGQPAPEPRDQYLVVQEQVSNNPFPESYHSQNSGCSSTGGDFTGNHWEDLLESFHTEPNTPIGARFKLDPDATGSALLDAQEIKRERGSGDIHMPHDTEDTVFEIFHTPQAG